MDHQFQTPILFIIFNRPDTTAKVFEKIKDIKPIKLYIVADGPRSDKKDDNKRCLETREIINNIKWQCEVHKNYSEVNLGCEKRVSSGINWFFENENKGIILEDDCLPNDSFFKFCEEMLAEYENEERIGSISGNNFQFGKMKNEYSYYFSRYPHIWGWATWKRAWDKYDVNISNWPKIKKTKLLSNIFNNKKDAFYWASIFDDTYNSKIDTWDYQWTYSCLTNNYLTIIPSENLVSNIGFSEYNSTHTKKKNKFSNMETHELQFPLKKPTEIERNIKADKVIQKNNYPFWRHIIKKFIIDKT